MGKRRIIAETGAGQHGVATATVCALFGFECVVYMGTEDMRRQELNVFRMRLLGAEVRGVDSGSRTLKDAINEAMRDWVTNVRTTHYLLGCVLGAHPYPTMVRDFHRVIGREARAQILKAEGRLPDGHHRLRRRRLATPSASSTSSSNDKQVKLIGVEAGGRGRASANMPPAFEGGSPGVLQGTYSYLFQDEAGQIATTHSVSAGLDYRRRRPRARLAQRFRPRRYVSAPDAEALDACTLLGRTEGIIPALESSHASRRSHEARPHMPRNGNRDRQHLRPRRQGHRHPPRKFNERRI